MALTARAIAGDTPGLKDKFRVPVPRTDQALLTAGRLFARDAEPFKDQFLAHAMPQTFLADLIGLVETFEEAIQEREEGKGGSTAARASISATYFNAARTDATYASTPACVPSMLCAVPGTVMKDLADVIALWNAFASAMISGVGS